MVDLHCDSIGAVGRGVGLVKAYNFSNKRPQLQLVALFSGEVAPRAAYAKTERLLHRFRACMRRERAHVAQVRDYGEIERTLAGGRHAALLSIEGGSCLLHGHGALRHYVAAGVRVVGLCWHSNGLASSTHPMESADTGLTEKGRRLVARGNALGVIFDLSHASDKTFFEVLSLAEKPPLATHSNFRAVCPHPRNVTDEMARALVARGGLIGLNLYPPFLHKDPTHADVAALFSHIDHALATVGVRGLALGGDIDGTDGQYPAPLDTARSLHDALLEEMLRHNYSEEVIGAIAYRNALGFFESNLPSLSSPSAKVRNSSLSIDFSPKGWYNKRRPNDRG